ncbi:TA system VapC family ribonuclease toxin [Nocardia sp. NPDC049707]|uniref:TA system VapC family ribonuclease toxin n=1 Tax=Nocardia sp. NPDC049707 TaxID=3154735 RepID=UPI00341B59C9
MTLVDVGVWLAAVWGRHVHHKIAAAWFGEQTDSLLLCRVTQTGLLRLLSNPAVMGTDVLTRSAAWRIVDQLNNDERVLWAEEPAELEAVFRAFSARDDNSHKLWTDDYLAAFAQTSNAALATLDRKLAARYPSVQVVTLNAE